MLKRFAGIALKLAASLAFIGLFFFISARVPYFQEDGSISRALYQPVTSRAIPASEQHTGSLTLVDGDARFSGSFFDAASDGGFEMHEVDVPPPCAGAGERYLASSCPQCSTTPAVNDTGEPPTLTWVDDSGAQARIGTIYRDCTATLANGMVRVPLLSFSNSQIGLGVGSSADSDIPALANADRASQMSLGNWSITIDNVIGGMNALEQMSRLLENAGWSEVSRGEQQPSEFQRVFTTGASRLCVITLNQSGGAYQLVTMMNRTSEAGRDQQISIGNRDSGRAGRRIFRQAAHRRAQGRDHHRLQSHREQGRGRRPRRQHCAGDPARRPVSGRP